MTIEHAVSDKTPVLNEGKSESTANAYADVNRERVAQQQQSETKPDFTAASTNDAIRAFQNPADGSVATGLKSLSDAMVAAAGDPSAIDKIAANLNKANVGIIAERDRDGNLDVRYMGSREGVKIGVSTSIDWKDGSVKTNAAVEGYKVGGLGDQKSPNDGGTLTKPKMETRQDFDNYRNQMEHDIRGMLRNGQPSDQAAAQIKSGLTDYASAAGMDAAQRLVEKVNTSSDAALSKLSMTGTEPGNLNIKLSSASDSTPSAPERPSVRGAFDKQLAGDQPPAGVESNRREAAVEMGRPPMTAQPQEAGREGDDIPKTAAAPRDRELVKSLVDRSGVPEKGREGLQKALTAAVEGRFEDLAKLLRGPDSGQFYNQFKNAMNKAGMEVKVTGMGDISIAPIGGGEGVRMQARGWSSNDSRPSVYTFEQDSRGVKNDFKSTDKEREARVAFNIKIRLMSHS